MLLRYGTILDLVQNSLGYTQVELSDKLCIPQSSLNSYVSGARVPTLRSEVRHRLKNLIIEVAKNYNLQHSDISNFALNVLFTEINMRKLFEIYQETFKSAAAKVLIQFLRKTESGRIQKTAEATDCLKILLEGKSDFYNKATIALYLAQKAKRNGFVIKEESVWGETSIPATFFDIDSLLRSSENMILEPQFAQDVFLSLPENVSLNYDINDNYRLTLKVVMNSHVSDELLIFKGNTLMRNIS